MNRRNFLRLSGSTIGSLALSTIPTELFAGANYQRLTILHTNDVHSRIDPFEYGRNAGLGGAAPRASLINQIRKQEKQVLLLDAGDIFQGTPYFNYFNGEIEMKLMSEMGYDAATIGNHDFDAGIEGLEKQLKHMNFPFLISNYDFSDTVMSGKTKENMIIEKGGLKIGLFGLGIELEGLVPSKLTSNTQYLDPVPIALEQAGRLKHDYHCDFVICLSHLGFKYKEKKISDITLAEQSKDIDLIIGGHTHTFLNEPIIVGDANNKQVLINQVGFAGINLGRIDVYFSRNGTFRLAESKVLPVKS